MNEMDILEDCLQGIVSEIRENLAATGTNASGKTSDSLEVVMHDGGGMILGRKYFQSVEEGRPPGRVPVNFPEIIRQWMKDKGIVAHPIFYKRKPSANWQPKYTPEERGERAMAYAISEKIKTEGTQLFRNGGRRDIYTNAIDNGLKELEQKIIFDIKSRI